MLANIRRSQYEGWFGSVYYVLDAQIELSGEEAYLVERHGLGNYLVFDSEAREQYQESTQQHLEATKGEPPIFGSTSEILWGSATVAYNIGAALVTATLGSLSLQVTVNDLIHGAHVESENAEEILKAEALIREAIEGLNSFLGSLATFDGRDNLYAP